MRVLPRTSPTFWYLPMPVAGPMLDYASFLVAQLQMLGKWMMRIAISQTPTAHTLAPHYHIAPWIQIAYHPISSLKTINTSIPLTIRCLGVDLYRYTCKEELVECRESMVVHAGYQMDVCLLAHYNRRNTLLSRDNQCAAVQRGFVRVKRCDSDGDWQRPVVLLWESTFATSPSLC
jgi:hypothetical protein